MISNEPLTLWLDTETYNETSIKVGAHRYAETAEILIISLAIDDDPVVVWDTSDPETRGSQLASLQNLIDKADRIVIQNSAFDRTVLRHSGVTIPVDKIVDTMVVALQHGLVGKLEQLCEVLHVPIDKAKDKAGKKLIQLFTKPRPKNMKLRRATKETHPDEWQQFLEYARLDVVSMREVLRRLPTWNCSASELDLWRLDQDINDRGIAVDLELAHAASRAFERTVRSLAVDTARLTGGVVSSTTQVANIRKYLEAECGLGLPDMTAKTIESVLRSKSLDPRARALLGIRQQAAATSPAKYRALSDAVSSDGRLRGTIQFCGAARTGRDAGRIFQPQNLPRTPDWFDEEVQEITIAALKADAADLLWEDVSERCSMSVRGSIIAGPNRKLVISDLSNIEGRVLAWLAGEHWKIEAFKAYDRGEGPDLYKVTAGKILGKDPADVTKDERQSLGKVPELACLGLDTQVLTNNGVKTITEVSEEDLLWDGEEWVRHEGLVVRGERSTLWLAGLEVTPDHELLVGQTWLSAQTVASSPSTQDLALVTALENLPWSAWTQARWEAYERSWCAVRAARRHTPSASAISEKDAARAAMRAPRRPQDERSNNISATRPFALMTPIEGVCATGLPPRSAAATTPRTEPTITTAGAGSRSLSCGAKTAAPFWRTWFRWLVGTILRSKWIGSTLIEATNREIFGLSASGRTATTCAEYPTCKRASKSLRPVFDIANAGPRNRFTVLTDTGAFIVHNCGYQGGLGAFRVMGGRTVEAMSDEEIQEIVWAWRAQHPATKSLWYDIERAAKAAIREVGITTEVRRGLLRFDVRNGPDGAPYLRMRLPSGRFLCYRHPSIDGDSEQILYWGLNQYTRKWEQLETYGGKLTENAVQAIARDVLFHGMRLAVANSYHVVLRVHDELVCEVPDRPEFSVGTLSELMSRVPSWATGLPLAAAGFEAYRYRKD